MDAAAPADEPVAEKMAEMSVADAATVDAGAADSGDSTDGRIFSFSGDEGGAPIPGGTMDRSDAGGPRSWFPADASHFRVRVGPNYKKNGKKEPSGPSFYECVACDHIKADQMIHHVGAAVQLPPDIVSAADTAGVPPLLIINCQMPYEGPSLKLGAKKVNGCSFVYYFKLKDSVAEALASPPESQSPSMRLLGRYLKEAPTDRKLQGRFKVVAQIVNHKEMGFGSATASLVNKYNGKPVIINKTGTLHQGNGYLEMDINVHQFSVLARKTLKSLQPKVPAMQLRIGFVIEASDDSELPEQLLGCADISALNFVL